MLVSFKPGDVVTVRRQWGCAKVGVILRKCYSSYQQCFDRFEIFCDGKIIKYTRQELNSLESGMVSARSH